MFIIFFPHSKPVFFVLLYDSKERNEFMYDSGQIMEWLWGIADIKK